MALLLLVLAVTVLGHALSTWLLRGESNVADGAECGPFERATASALCSLSLLVACNWLLSFLHAFTTFGLVLSACAMLAVGGFALRRRWPLIAEPARSFRSIFDRRHRAIHVALAPVLAWLVFILWRGAVLPILSDDAFIYHLPKAVMLMRARGYAHFSAYDHRIADYPFNYEFLVADIFVLNHSDRLVEWISTLSYVLFVLSSVAVAERFWSKGPHLLGVLLLTAGLPVALLQSGATKNDLLLGFLNTSAILFAARWCAHGGRAGAVLAAMALALAAGTKFTAAAPMVGVFVAVALGLIDRFRQRKALRDVVHLPSFALLMVLSVGLFFFQGGYPYADRPASIRDSAAAIAQTSSSDPAPVAQTPKAAEQVTEQSPPPPKAAEAPVASSTTSESRSPPSVDLSSPGIATPAASRSPSMAGRAVALIRDLAWDQLIKWPVLIFVAPFSPRDFEVWVPWKNEYWFWPRFDFSYSNFGIPFSVALLIFPFFSRRALGGSDKGAKERRAAAIISAIASAILLLMPPPIKNSFCFYQRYLLFLVPIVGALGLAPWLKKLFASQSSSAWSPRKTGKIAIGLLSAGVLLQGIFCADNDVYAPLSYVKESLRQRGSRRTHVMPDRGAFVADRFAGPLDTIAFDAGPDTWIYPAYGSSFTRAVVFLDPSKPGSIPNEADWVVIDRAHNILWDPQGFSSMENAFDHFYKGHPLDEDLRVFRALEHHPNFELVFHNARTNQAVFKRVREHTTAAAVR